LAQAFTIDESVAQKPSAILSLSISHSSRYAVAAALVSRSSTPHAVGIDLELQDRVIDPRVLSRIAHAEDVTANEPPLAQWCAKEAALKTLSNGEALLLSDVWLRHAAPGCFRFGMGDRGEGVAMQIPFSNHVLYVGEAPMARMPVCSASSALTHHALHEEGAGQWRS